MKSVQCQSQDSNPVLDQKTQKSRRKGGHHYRSSFFSKSFIIMFTIVNIMIGKVLAEEEKPRKIADGIGYREQELQLAKGAKFSSEVPNGVKWASFNGGTHIFFKSVKLNLAPEKNTIWVFSQELQQSIPCPPMTEEDIFNSQPATGSISYRLPSIPKLFNLPPEAFDHLTKMNFIVSVMAPDEPSMHNLHCKNENRCKLTYQRDYTPTIYFISPRVTYFESVTEVWFNPHNTMSLIEDLDGDELPFINAKIGGNLIDFEDRVDSSTAFSAWNLNAARGQIGEGTIDKNQNITMMWETGNAAILDAESKMCDFNNSNCYQAKSIPVIFDISENVGYVTGGQNITVKGFGFDAGKVHAVVDGQNCTVTSSSRYEFDCTLQPKANVSDLSRPYQGQHGATRFFTNSSEHSDGGDLAIQDVKSYKSDQMLALDLQAETNIGDKIASFYKTWFVPPETGRYRFYMSCDQQCRMFLAQCQDTIAPLTEIIQLDTNTTTRAFFSNSNYEQEKEKQSSDWIHLTKGEPYYMEVTYVEHDGVDHMSTGVEFEQTAIVNHHQAMKEVQMLKITPDQKKEKIIIDVTNPDGGSFRITFKNPKTGKFLVNGPIECGASARRFEIKVRAYYRRLIKSRVIVTRTDLDVDGIDIRWSKKPTVTNRYIIEVEKLISGPTTSQIILTPVGSKAILSAKIPDDVQLSSPPLSGKFDVICVSKDGQESKAIDLDVKMNYFWIAHSIQQQCVGLYNKVEGLPCDSKDVQKYPENGNCFKLRFNGVAANPGSFRLQSSESSIQTGKDYVYSQKTIIPYGTNLFYNPIPFEMLRTYEEKPQFLVTVDDQPVACHNMTCDYTYVKPVGEITGTTYDDATRKLIITGVDLPTLLLSNGASSTSTNSTASASTTSSTSTDSSTTGDADAGGRRRLTDHRKLTGESTSDNSTSSETTSTSTSTATDNTTTSASNNSTESSSSSSDSTSSTNATTSSSDNSTASSTDASSSTDNSSALANSTTPNDSASNATVANSTIADSSDANATGVNSTANTTETNSTATNTTAVVAPAPEPEITLQCNNSIPSTKTLNNPQPGPAPSTIRKIRFGQMDCEYDAAASSSTKIECTLKDAPVCGIWKPEVIGNLGRIPNAEALVGIQVNCTFTQIQPDNFLNVLGADNLTIIGTNFPRFLGDNTVDIEFSNTPPTKCIAQRSNSTHLICLTKSFNKTAALGQSWTVKIVINNVTIDNVVTVKMKDVNKDALQIVPPTASPVLKTKVQFKLQENFPFNLTKEDFTVNITLLSLGEKVSPYYKQSQNTNVRFLNVIKVYNENLTLETMFGGAYSGTYSVQIRHTHFGLVDTADLRFVVGSEVTSISPRVGSVYGGQLLTITGTNWDSDPQNNAVSIVFNGALGAMPCYVQTTSQEKITCRLKELDQNAAKTNEEDGTVVVFLKLSEESVCNDPEECKYTFTNALPNVTAIDKEWDSSLNVWTIKLSGTSFTGDASTSMLTVQGIEQPAVAVLPSTAQFKVTNAPSKTLTGIRLYLDIGIPDGNRTLLDQGVVLTPKFVGMSSNKGSQGGSTIVLNVQGIGSSDEVQAIQYTDAEGATKSLCSNHSTIAYGKIECKTLPGTIPASTAVKILVNSDTPAEECSNTDTSACLYEQTDSGMPVISDAKISSPSEITFTGTNFFETGYQPIVEFGGVKADNITIVSDSSIVSKWIKGVPVVVNATSPILYFEKLNTTDEMSVVHYASGQINISNALDITGATNDLACSFNGGCQFEVQAKGLATLFRGDPENNFITICDRKCIYQDDVSTDEKAQCLVPEVSTTYSDENFKISVPSEDLKTGEYFGTFTNNGAAFDDILTEDQGNSTVATGNCSIGMSFKPGHVGLISQVKWFMGDITSGDTSYLVDNLIFQGSNDNITYTDVFFVDENVHEGWNYHSWTKETQQKFRFYRFQGSESRVCLMNEIKFTGVETIDDDQPQFACAAKIEFQGSQQNLTQFSGQVTYKGALTPKLVSISPRFGPVTGGTDVTFSGSGFSTILTENQITIDGIDCPVKAATEDAVTCTTGKRRGLRNSTLMIKVANKGDTALQQKVFRYVSYWSDDTTWGGEFAPMEMESVYVPTGLNLFVDVDSTPMLNTLIVEGSLIFAPDPDPNHQRTFDAHIIFVRNGKMEVGTEEFPYTSKITITMHSDLLDPYLPIYGNKVIGCRFCELDMHGPERIPTWTMMEETAEAGADKITLQQEVDWVVGELIGVASTDFEGRHAEKRTIIAIDRTNPEKPIITMDKAFEYKHYAATQQYGNETIDMRAEVGLLSRNVKFQGDPETSPINQYGATIFLHSLGDDSLTAKLGFIEMTNVGQAFKVGRYAVHFHMIGAVHQSYANGCSTHESNNRAFTIHGTHYLRISKNVVYATKGHNIFIEDAAETKNIMSYNLVMKTMRSMSLLNTDATPGSFWITHPDNALIGNHAGGSDRYAFWYDLQDHAMGPSANINICSRNARVGEFRNNSAHSNGRYGLRIFHNMVPREFPCRPIVRDSANEADPYHANRPITANFNNFTGWKCGRNGAIAEKVGVVKFNNFKTADNKLAGIEFEIAHEFYLGDIETAGIFDALVIGKSNNTEEALERMAPHGVISPRSDGFSMRNIRFHNYNWKSAAAIGDCSHCFHEKATDSGARTVRISQMQFFNVNKRIKYQSPVKGIFLDIDGTTTDQGPNSWATPYRKFHEWPGCNWNSTVRQKYDGIVCDGSVTFRRIAFKGYPTKHMHSQDLNILKWDDSITSAMNSTELKAYVDKKSNWDTYGWLKDLEPRYSTTGAFAIGHKYRISWGSTGLDFEEMRIYVSEEFQQDDKSLFFVHNFTDRRDEIKVKYMGQVIPNNTIPDNAADYVSGQNLVLNNSIPNDPREQLFSFILNGKNKTRWSEGFVSMGTTRCIGPCNAAVEEEVEEVGEETLWSNPKSWPSGKVPVADEDVEIQSGWNMTMDVADTPTFRLVTVNGLLNFKRGMDITFRSKSIFVRAGEFHVGSKENPFTNNCKIILSGNKSNQAMAYDSSVEAGNKVFANINVVKMYGKARNQTMTRLYHPALKGATNFTVEKGQDIVPGDRLAILPTSYEPSASDCVIVETYDTITGFVTVNSSLNFYHWGSPKSTGDKFGGVDMRGEVIMLTRNIQIQGEDVESWGGHFITGDTAEISEDGQVNERIGNTFMDWVEMHNLSQIDTDHAAMRWENAQAGFSEVTNCSLHNGYGWGVSVKSSNNILFKDNRVYNFRPIGMMISNVKNVTVDRNVVAHIATRASLGGEAEASAVDPECGICTCSYVSWTTEYCINVRITNNIVAGAHWIGMTLPGYRCGKPELSNHFGNVVHSVNRGGGGYGAAIHPDRTDTEQLLTCFESSGIITYKNGLTGTVFGGAGPQHVVFKNMTGIDNARGLYVGSSKSGDLEYQNNTMQLHDSNIYGESPMPDCPQNGQGGYCYKTLTKCGLTSSGMQQDPRMFHPSAPPGKPMHKANSFASWGSTALFNNNRFINFYPKTATGSQQNVFCLNKSSFDKVPVHLFRKTTMENVSPDAMAYIMAPSQGWANLADCGDFPCTGPLNVLFSFVDTKYKRSLFNHGKDFQIISNNTGLSPYLDSCKPYPAMNAYICHSNTLGIMQFESEDADKVDRGMQPIFIGLNGTMQANKLNSFMDNTWDGFYAGQIRLSRFPALIDGNGGVYNMSFTGSPAKKMRFIFNSNNKTAGMTLRIAYPSAESRSITINGNLVEMNQWDDKYQMYGPITQSFCGENRYIGVKNILEFYLSEGCELQIIPRDAIQCLVRMEWTLDSFFANGGTTSLMDRVAASLGIHASTIKIVSVYEGSLVVNYEIGASDPVALAQVQAKQTQAFATNTMSLGAPILDVQVTTSSSQGSAAEAPAAPVSVVSGGTVTAPGYDPIIITKTVSNDPVMAAAAAASATSSGTATSATAVSTSTTVVSVTKDRDGSSSYGVINSSGSSFQPNIQVVVNGNSKSAEQGKQATQQATEQAVEKKAMAELEIQIEQSLYEDMDLTQGGSADNGSLIIIISIVVLGLIGTSVLTIYMIRSNKHQRITEANKRHQQMLELQNAKNLDDGDQSIPVKQKNPMFIKKLNKGDFVIDHENEESAEQQLRKGDQNPLNELVQYGDQYNANHDFAIFQANNERLGGLMNLAQKQNQADCVADKSMSVASSFVTERAEEDWAHTERDEDDPKTPLNQSLRGKSVKFGDDDNNLPENQEWSEL